MSKTEYSGLLISDFTIDNLAGYLNNDGGEPKVESAAAPYGQWAQVLMDKNLKWRKRDPDFVVVWTRPDEAIRSFSRLLDNKSVSIKDIFSEVDKYSSMILDIRAKAKTIFVPTWTMPAYRGGLGMIDMKPVIGISNTLMKMNVRLAESLNEAANIYVLDAGKWNTLAGHGAFNPKLWYMGKIAYGNEVFIEAAKDIKSALRGISGSSRKLIILDLDDTLWSGIAGDIGWENIRLGGQDPVGEAYADFQRALKSLANRGILLGVVSKNEETLALEVIKKHPEMILGLNDFAGWRINWNDKAQNIVDLVSELNLGLQSAVFIDDNPAERSRVREALPEVLVPEWPADVMMYTAALADLRCFDSPCINREDIRRTKMYVSERRRKDLKKKVGSIDDWLKGLKIRIKIEELNKANLPRAAQLLNKTNQMNLAARRLTESELESWVKSGDRKLWTFRVSDRFGDSGLAGIASLEMKKGSGEITDFVLSCRVMGRNIEEAMLSLVIEYARSAGLSEVCAEYIPSSKNKPCLEFFSKSGFIRDGGYKFTWKTKRGYKVPGHIAISGIRSSEAVCVS